MSISQDNTTSLILGLIVVPTVIALWLYCSWDDTPKECPRPDYTILKTDIGTLLYQNNRIYLVEQVRAVNVDPTLMAKLVAREEPVVKQDSKKK